MPREITERNLLDCGDERFEQLVGSLVLAEHPDPERPRIPDGGADVLVTATAERKALVWQAKRRLPARAPEQQALGRRALAEFAQTANGTI